ncbi:MAG: SAM-dependent chlorinase/fluorinase, partial [Deltaproteobacteria bacterium]|nr:SAM-dependent chlorinase/fluorinase [Deltaproteobacteria bacterium]
FHGRDVFAPVAAHLACGAKLEDLGPAVMKIVPAPIPEPAPQNDGSLLGEIIAIDNFGNCVTNLNLTDVLRLGSADRLEVSLSGGPFSSICMTYSDVAPGANLALFGSSGRLELAIRDGNLCEKKSINRGVSVRVKNTYG